MSGEAQPRVQTLDHVQRAHEFTDWVRRVAEIEEQGDAARAGDLQRSADDVGLEQADVGGGVAGVS